MTLQLGAEFFLELGDKLRSLELMRQSQELQESGSPIHANLAFNMITTADELAAAIPQRYPQIGPWLRHFRSRIPKLDPIWKETIERGLLEALEHLKYDWTAKAISAVKLKAASEELYPYSLLLGSNSTRRLLDFLLAEANTSLGERSAAIFFRRKSSLLEVPVLLAVFRGLSFDDPTNKMIYSWKSPAADLQVKLDIPHQNIGIYLLEEEAIDTLILSSQSRYSGLPYNRLRIYHSSNNLDYSEISAEVSITDYRIENKQYILLHFQEPPQSYLKILYPETQTHHKFNNELYTMVKAYRKGSTDPEKGEPS